MEPFRSVAESAPARRAASLWGEFRDFAFKGNVVDLAVGVIVGSAFGKIVDALVKSVLMPLIGAILPGDEGFRGWKWVVRGQEVAYGQFLAEVAHFLIVAVALFVFLHKFLGWAARKREAAPPAPTPQEELLAEIRDLLREGRVPAPPR